MVDVSIILNIHRERAYARRTLDSIEAAAHYASVEGITCELVIVADRSDQETLNWYNAQCYQAFIDVRIIQVDNGSLGLSRNDGIKEAIGEFILTADADDLISANTISASVNAARLGNRKTIYFPNWYVAFSAQPHLYEISPLSVVGSETFFGAHPYVSRFLARRDEISNILFHDLRLTSGFAFEDWQYNMDLIAEGFALEVVSDVTVYYRQRANSLLREANSVSLAIPKWSKFFEPTIYLNMAQNWPRLDNSPNNTSSEAIVTRFLNSRSQIEMLLMAAEIDPAIDPNSLQWRHAFSNATADNRLGKTWTKICHKLDGESFDEILLVPFITPGGGEKYIFNVIDSILRLHPTKKVLVISGQPFDKQYNGFTQDHRMFFLDFPDILGFYDEEMINTLTLRAIQTFGQKSKLHIKSSPFTWSFLRKYAKVLELEIIYYRFCDASYNWFGQFVRSPNEFDFLSDVGEYLDKIICDNEFIREQDTSRLDHLIPRYEVLYNWVSASLHDRAGKNRARVLWASRLDSQKRISLLANIAEKLEIISPDVLIDVWGSSILDDENNDTISRLRKNKNVNLCGGFSGFESLPLENYGLFLYTSAFDGLPNVILEAMRAGFPVVSSLVGGVGEVLSDKTGYPIPNSVSDEALVNSYVLAIQEAISDSAMCENKVKVAQNIMINSYDISLYDQHISALWPDNNDKFMKAKN